MLLPISWLNEYVNVSDIPTEVLQKSLFSCGFEVEEVVNFGGAISRCVVGKILTLVPHENSDHLQIVTLDVGEYGSELQIVTGAHNIAVGDYVPVALDGSTLAGGVKIKNGMLRGVPSYGMLCSGEELGIDDDWYEGASVHGILILHEPVAPGTDIKDVLDMNQEIYDVTITANRPDCQSVYGLAREVAAYFKRELKPLELDYTVSAEHDETIHVSVEDADLCPRYIAHDVKDVMVCKSPELIRRRLKMCGHNAINSIVDITNYILVELGQPMHAFDCDHVTDNTIIVRRAKAGETIQTLDEKVFELTTDNLLICDAKEPVCIAGVMGGLNSGIRETTKDIIFEAAKFARDSVRKTSRALGQSSASSAKFSKGVDAYTTELAMNRALHLICEYGYGKVGCTRYDIGGAPAANTPVTTTYTAINRVLGIEVPVDEINGILSRLNFELTVDGDNISATAPAYREDVESYPDLSEEVIRMYGYDHITPKLMENAHVTSGGYTFEQKIFNKVQDTLAEAGCFETISYAFYSRAELDLLRLPSDALENDIVSIMNPLSDNYAIMRTTLVPTLCQVMARNAKRGNESGRFFEIARRFTKGSGDRPVEEMMVCVGAYGDNETFFTVKGITEKLADAFKLRFEYRKANKPFLHPGMTAEILLNGQVVGYVGKLSYEVTADFEISKAAYICELEFAPLAAAVKSHVKYVPIPKFPEVDRDYAFVAREEITNGEIVRAVKAACPAVSKVKIFDVYRGKNLPEGHKSVAYKVTFTPGDKALDQEQLDAYTSKILKRLERMYGITIRS
ncbi:MAG: phenylalanine--tRNA ligase subunit beta [Clostridia bacterium]|nr:phenylalanine--tRNA ligase subunit beta [Clostridia bacterium]